MTRRVYAATQPCCKYVASAVAFSFGFQLLTLQSNGVTPRNVEFVKGVSDRWLVTQETRARILYPPTVPKVCRYRLPLIGRSRRSLSRNVAMMILKLTASASSARHGAEND